MDPIVRPALALMIAWPSHPPPAAHAAAAVAGDASTDTWPKVIMRIKILALIGSLCVHFLVPRGTCAQPTNWTLDDQFGRTHVAAEWKGRTVLLIAGADSLPFLVVGLADIGNAPRVQGQTL
jgi:hypothetical protein